MAERRSSRDKRCPQCKIQFNSCFCDKVKVLQCSTKLSAIIHQKEKFLPSNTVNLLKRNFPHLETYTRGAPDGESCHFEVSKDHYPLFLFPDENAVALTPEFISRIHRPIQLIIPDGTWRQARKIHRRMPSMQSVQTIKIVGNYKSLYTLRKQKFEYGLSTYEAVAKALEVIESPQLACEMLEQFKIMNDSFQQTRPLKY